MLQHACRGAAAGQRASVGQQGNFSHQLQPRGTWYDGGKLFVGVASESALVAVEQNVAMSNENQYLKSHVEQIKEELRQVRQTSNLQQHEIQVGLIVFPIVFQRSPAAFGE
ncbi:unnamed protein product [Dibothriocephalus latus]|uniref:Uncharacterized protein n=1 Tax=Dibothriocephalus latus TaxID=60516 RepID=A0A3P6QYI3_DIBLA|nr:unnamed protein product [Dibothriocephalus latus]